MECELYRCDPQALANLGSKFRNLAGSCTSMTKTATRTVRDTGRWRVTRACGARNRVLKVQTVIMYSNINAHLCSKKHLFSRISLATSLEPGGFQHFARLFLAGQEKTRFITLDTLIFSLHLSLRGNSILCGLLSRIHDIRNVVLITIVDVAIFFGKPQTPLCSEHLFFFFFYTIHKLFSARKS